MSKVEILKPCPCGTGINFESCCQPLILGLEKAKTAEKLLRSRYTAFVAGEIDYIISTNHPDTAKDLDRKGLEEWSLNSKWQGLEILRSENGGEKDEEGFLEFKAVYSQDGQVHYHHETSLFKHKDGEWFFYDVRKNLPIKNAPQPGRNDPCVCGSGKKYKKCCGK